MGPVKTFEEFRRELNESRKMNEGVLDTVKKTLQKVGDFFKGQYSKFLNALVAQEKGQLPKGVKIYPNKADMDLLKKYDTEVKEPAIPENYMNFDDEVEHVDENEVSNEEVSNEESSNEEAVNEAKISLEHPNKNILNVNAKKLKFLLETHIDAGEAGRKPMPMLIWGAPGIGKTAIIEEVAKFHDMSLGNNRLIVIDLATMSPEDFFLPAAKGGVGIDFDPTSKSTRLPMDYLPVYDVREGKAGDDNANGVDGKGGVIFFDEIARCSAKVQDVLMKLCDDSRRVGNYELGSKWVIVCAANRESDEVDSSKTYVFSSTLGNRFTQVNFVPTFDDWASWAGSAKDEEGDYIVTPEITTFLRFFQDYWHNIDPDTLDTEGGKPTIFPTPRSWTKASIAIKNQKNTAKKLGEPFTTQMLYDAIAQSVGTVAAGQFKAFLELSAKIDPKDIDKVYTDAEKAPTLKTVGIKGDLNGQIGLIAAVTMKKSREKLDDKEMLNFIKWLIICDDETMAIKALTQFLHFHKEESKSDYFEEELLNMFFEHYPNLTRED